MLRFILVACAAALSHSVAASPPPKSSQPTAVGSKWVYDEDGVETTEVVTRTEKKGAETTVWVGRVSADNKVTPWEVLLVADDSVYRLEREGVKDIPRLGLLVIPHLTAEAVDVPAGKYSAHPFTVLGTFGGTVGETVLVLDETRWYVPDVGLVKSTLGYKQGDGRVVLSTKVLKSFKSGP